MLATSHDFIISQDGAGIRKRSENIMSHKRFDPASLKSRPRLRRRSRAETISSLDCRVRIIWTRTQSSPALLPSWRIRADSQSAHALLAMRAPPVVHNTHALLPADTRFPIQIRFDFPNVANIYSLVTLPRRCEGIWKSLLEPFGHNVNEFKE